MFPVTLAEPELALCELVLVTVRLLLLVTVAVVVLLLVTWLLEPGPVVEIVPEPEPPPAAPPHIPAAEALFTLAEALKLLLFEAAPEPAEPALVLPETVAVPELAPCPLLLLTPRLLLLLTLATQESLFITWLFESGPVVPILPELAPAIVPIPAMRLSDVIATPATFTIFFISPPFWN